MKLPDWLLYLRNCQQIDSYVFFRSFRIVSSVIETIAAEVPVYSAVIVVEMWIFHDS